MALWQSLIAVDQLVNTFIDDYPGGPGGWADETISSRAWRLSAAHRRWELMQRLVDGMFRVLRRQKDHCFESYISERLRLQSPPELR